ncbi:MAG: hypothetical protein K2K21_15310 [Lachnospiraceae bacterium]|nr:hypothetical protein [Lachnospiraceae bacterium]
MKCLNKFIAIALCFIIFINNSNIAYANTDYPIENAESTNDMDVRIYKVPVISNECTGSTITFYGYNGKFYLALDDIKDFTRYKFNESDSQLILGHGIREIRIEKETGHMTDCNCVDQGIIDILEYNGKYLCEGIPMLTYLGADCTVRDGKALEILMPSFTIWEAVMLSFTIWESVIPDYADMYLNRITDCAVDSIVDFSTLSDDLLIPEWMEFFEAQSLSEKELLAKTRAASGYPMKDYVYVDMDHDGLKELIGVADSGDNKPFQTWYCSSDGETCLLIHQNSMLFDDLTIELLEFNYETHVVINSYNLIGTSKEFSIISLKNGEACIKASEEYGYVFMTKSGDILLDVEDYDGIYDPDTLFYSHTWIDTYLCFDGESYKEYIAYEITESEYLKFINAQEIKDRIADELTESDTIELEYTYFKRKNNILHIQCNVHQSSGTIYYGYYTVRYSGDVLDEQFIIPDNQSKEYNPGQMSPRLSYFEAAP